ncbi:MAG: hypothetical protein JXA15_04390 [Spirochaetales bacterium]|nr:hypothetical protein [Spirochaetales bacterium]
MAFFISTLALAGAIAIAISLGLDGYRALDARAVPGSPAVAGWGVAGALFAVLSSASFLALIAFRASSSVSQELFFLSFFFFSLTAEAARTGLGAAALGGASMEARDLLARSIVFARTFGTLSVFAAGLHASGYRDDKPWSAVWIMAFAALGVTVALPVNSGDLSVGLMPPRGFAVLSTFFEVVVAGGAVLNFLLAARNRASRVFLAATGGVVAALMGAVLLREAVEPLGFAFGGVALWAGALTCFMTLRRHYLWQ